MLRDATEHTNELGEEGGLGDEDALTTGGDEAAFPSRQDGLVQAFID
jgi:hypothetical protein